MKNRTEAHFKKWIEEQIEHYKPILGVSLQLLKIEKVDKNYMQITCTYPYLDPTIGYNEECFQDWCKGELRRDRVLHELCHMITDSLYCKAVQRHVSQDEIKDERERLTDTIAMIIRGLDK